MNVLLIYPKFPDTFWSFKYALKFISERMVGLKMADAYKGLDVIILPSDGPHGVNPLDLNNALQLFDVRKGGGQ